MRDGVLSVSLDATTGTLPPEAGKPVRTPVVAFAERGRTATVPAPLIRVPAGTTLRVNVRNTLADPVTLFLPTSPLADDSVVVAPGASGELSVRLTTPGNLIYRGTTPRKLAQRVRVAGAMAGAVVVDTANAPRVPTDRVFVLSQIMDSTVDASMEAGHALGEVVPHTAFTINGRAWPNTEPLSATVGDTLHWRLVNATFDIHPMHLHGFYYRVDDYTGRDIARDAKGAPGRMVVTERMSAFSAMSITWSPHTAGNWLMHCHFALHLTPEWDNIAKAVESGVPVQMDDHANHAQTGMFGLVLGINVAAKKGATLATAPANPRKLRLIAVSDSGYPPIKPSLRFVIEENGKQTTTKPGFSPTLYLKKGEPVAITVVNRLHEHTAVHWHGMELESYFDGVAGLSGSSNRIAQMIAPGDSFVARFTPPRSGTFMYHSHVDDIRQQPAGLVGAMIVRDGPEKTLPEDHEIFLKGARNGQLGNNDLEIGGVGVSDTIVAHAGTPMRLRFMSLVAVHPNATITLTSRPDSSFKNLADSMIVNWTPIAKDGADLPAAVRVPIRARQVIAMGETYDFEYTPRRRGEILRIEIRGLNQATGTLLARVPVRVD
ncbi:MAG TPA: multicopper oxidase domain-containing protein [Gemmatimonadaceae bacterium]|nr:multicopper oxidase domain-containing protein [Gemmatimonadaceae bacterium]